MTGSRTSEHWEVFICISTSRPDVGGGGETTISFDLGSWSLLILLFGKDVELCHVYKVGGAQVIC